MADLAARAEYARRHRAVRLYPPAADVRPRPAPAAPPTAGDLVAEYVRVLTAAATTFTDVLARFVPPVPVIVVVPAPAPAESPPRGA